MNVAFDEGKLRRLQLELQAKEAEARGVRTASEGLEKIDPETWAFMKRRCSQLEVEIAPLRELVRACEAWAGAQPRGTRVAVATTPSFGG